jgi:hypothetical protein
MAETPNDKICGKVGPARPDAEAISKDERGHYAENAPQCDNMKNSPSKDLKKPFTLGGK